MNKFILLLSLLPVLACPAYERLQGPTEVTYWDRAQTSDGYTLFGTQGTSYLIDMEGRVVHTWPLGILPRLLDNGHLLDATNGNINAFAGFQELDWNGSNVWRYTEARTNYFPHHDFIRIYNPKLGSNTTLYIANKTITSNQCVASGCNPANSAYTNVTVDAIVEVNGAGVVVWEWCFFDHGIQDIDAAKSNYVGSGKSITNYPGRLNLNLPGRPLTNDWLHCTSIDYNTNLDQIAISAEGGEFYVIDHGQTFLAGNPAGSIALAASTNGDFIYRFGDPARYGQGNPPSITMNWTVSTTGNKQIGGVSQAAWIPPGLPGAGDFLVFNNGQDLFETTPQSYIFEVNGYLNASGTDIGSYVNPPAANYNTWSAPGHDTDKQKKSMSRQIVSMFYAMANQAFFSHTGGSAQRLSNGNLLICSAAEGHIFEATSSGMVVWEYINPVTTNGVVSYKRDDWPLANPVYRATRYCSTNIALMGRTLVGTNTIACVTPVFISAPAISSVSQTPATPYSTNTVVIRAAVTNNRVISAVTLTYITASGTNAVAMTNAGSVYQAQIPGFAAGTAVRYYVSSSDEYDNTATYPLNAPTNTLSYTVSGAVVTNQPPVIAGTFVAPTSPTSNDAVWVTATITDDVSVASATLAYATGSGVTGTNTPFLETMRSTPAKPWSGDGCDHAWSITFSSSNPFEQRAASNYGAGNTNGMEFKNGTVNLSDSMITTTSAIDARGDSGFVEFYLWAAGQSGTSGWTLQLNGGTGYVTRLSELTGSNHGWQLYHYDLQSLELVSNLILRFQFCGALTDNRVDIDQIVVKTRSSGSTWTPVVMHDDGAHQDGAAGDGLFGAQIPAQPVGATIFYYLSATDGSGASTTAPTGAPVNLYSYTVVANATTNASNLLHLPDTGQIIGYTSTFGEDSDYAIHPPAYLNNGNGTISDKVTGLMWHQTDGGEMTWENAAVFAATNKLAGYTDWRLPATHELYSISKQGALNPAIDTNYFTVTAAEYWWTRDLQVGSTSIVWVANAGGGIGNHPKSETLSAGGSRRFHVRCVRGVAVPSTNSPIHHFVNTGNGTIIDTDTGLTWQQGEIASATNWEGALQYAGTNTLAGYTDWRLPNIKELQSINDETLAFPSVDTTYFPGVTASRYWSSTSMHGMSNEAWYLDCQYGLTSYSGKSSNLLVRCVRGGTTNVASPFNAQLVRIPGNSFIMGDQFSFYDPDHPSDEIPLHNVYISPLYIATTLATMNEYCAFLNAALYQGLIEVRSNIVYGMGNTNIYFYTHDANAYSFIQYSNGTFTVLDNRGMRPVTSVRWFGAVAYCNWLSQRGEWKPCYNLETGDVNFTNNGFRLPTEAEWEYCAHGGLTNPYCMFPWGTNSNSNGAYANWEGSGDPFESTNAYPCTTPVGFYNGSLRLKTDYNWPGYQSTYQTSDGSNPFGLYDMAGNVWQWVNDWYGNTYYTYCVGNNIVTNPPGPVAGDVFTNYGNVAYRALRGGTWYNGGGQQFYGYSRVSNRDPSWSLGPPPDGNNDSSWFQVGFRVMRPEKITQTVGLILGTTNAYPGYTLMSPMQSTNTYLLNNAGQYVHKWTSAYNPGRADYLLTNGHLLRACSAHPIISTGGGEGGRLEEHDWEGNLVWAFDLNTATNMSHHDFKVLPNGNVIMIVCEVKSYAEVLATGFNPALLDSSITGSGGFMLPDYVAEVQPIRPYGGTIVWEWHPWDHLIQDFSSGRNNYGVVSNYVERINPNGTGMMIQQFWNHMNGIDYNAQLDQIVLSVRGNSELWVIDHQTTTAQAASHVGGRYNKGGDLLYRWGNPAQYKLGTQANEMLWQQHDVTWIPTNCPGAGHLLIHDNGIGRGYSSIDEIIPPVDAYGNYARTAGAAFGPTGLCWTYQDTPPTNYYSSEISGAQRLPNGNTLICGGIFGKLFEVTTNGQTVWLYINPETTSPLAQGSAVPADTHMSGQFFNEVFKVRRYPVNYAGLVGKDLTPRGTVETYTGAATDTIGLDLPDLWVRSHFGTLSAVTAISSHSTNGLTDIQEYRYGLDPSVWSSTTNGIPDGWALAYGFEPTLFSVAALTNANGCTTLQSYQADLNPTNSNSRLTITEITPATNGVTLTWVGGSAAWQALESCTNLVANQWLDLFTNTPPTTYTTTVQHIQAVSPCSRFYRIRAWR